MPSITRLHDLCSGHGCYPPRPNDQASTNVFVNSKGAHRQGDHWQTHCCGDNCHDGNLARGSKTVFVNGIPLSRTGDPVNCGSAAMQGSGNTFAGG